MKKISVNRILIIRFRQIGDAVLSTAICHTLRENFPDVIIDMVLNKNIAPLFEHHPAIDHIIIFDEKERHSIRKYLCKIHIIMHQTHYDVIIDMRSTINTLPFSIFSLSTPFRIGVWKSYTRLIHNYRIKRGNPNEDMIQKNLLLLQPLEKIKPIKYIHKFSVAVTNEEKQFFKEYMEKEGIDFDKPIMLVGVTAKLPCKVWDENKMISVLKRLLNTYPNIQLVFNYAPGQEETNSRRIYRKLECNKNIFIDIKARNLRELAAMIQNSSFYFGNEGGARHIAQALGIPSYVVCSPNADKRTWIPQNDIPAQSIAPSDFLSKELQHNMSDEQKYNLIPVEEVWKGLNTMLASLHIFITATQNIK